MGYFDGLTARNFKNINDGRTIFFPWGAIGKGYVLESKEQIERFRTWMKRCHMITLVISILSAQTFGFPAGLAMIVPILVIYYLVYNWRIKKLTRGLKESAEKMTIRETQKTSAMAHDWGTLIIMEICSLGFVAAGIWILTVKSDQHSEMIGWSAILFFGLCALVFLNMMSRKRKQ